MGLGNNEKEGSFMSKLFNPVGVVCLCAWTGLVALGAESPRVLAHRGNYQYDDNALGGFQQSLAAGVTGIELDIHMTSDGGMIVMHDSTVSTTTTTTEGTVESMTFEAVTNLVLKKSGEHVPSLQQVVDLFRGRSDLFVEFEMKADGGHTGTALDTYVDNVYSIVSAAMPAGTYAFTSFSTTYLQAMKARHSTAPIGLIVSGALTQAQIDSAVSLGCCQIAPQTQSTAEMVSAARAAGLGVTLWMVEDLDTWQACRTKGATATTSNHPTTLYASVTNFIASEATTITSWNGERYFTNDVALTISAKLSGSEGLGKWGSGDLTISQSESDFTGDVILAGGTTFLTQAHDVKDTTTGALGNPRVSRTIMVTNGAALSIRGANAIGGGGTSVTPVLSDLHVVDATVNFQTNFACNLGDVYLHNATVTYYGGFPYGWRHWGTLLCRNLYFSGNKTYSFPKNGDWKDNNSNPENNCGLLIGKWEPDRMGEIRVPDLSGNSNVDVDFGWNLFCCVDNANSTDGCIGSFRKTGLGTLQLSSSKNNFRGNIRVEEGTLKLFGAGAVLGSDRSCVGNPQVVHTNYVGPGGTLWLAASDMQGQMYNDSKIVTHVDGGTLKETENCSNGMGPVILENATLDYAGHPGSTYIPATKQSDGSWVTNGPTFKSHWGTFAFNGGLWVKGTNTLALANRKAGNGTWSCLYFGANGISDFRVDDITKSSATDVTVGMRLLDGGVWCRHDQMRVTGTNRAATACSFRKTGAGTLEFNDDSINSDFSGPVEVAQGVWKISRGDAGWGRFYTENSPLGSTLRPHTITVHSGGELQLNNADVMGQLSKHCPGPTVVVSNGTLRINSGCCNGLPNLKFHDGSIIYSNGSKGARNWGLFGFNGLAEFGGEKGVAYDLPNGTANNWISLGYGTDLSIATNAAKTAVLYRGFTEMRVHDVTANAQVDVTIRPVLQDLPDWPTRTSYDTVVGTGRPVYFSCGLRKTGLGTLRVTNTNIYTGDTEVVEGALLVDSPSSKSPVTVKANGRLGGVGQIPSAKLEAGGGFTAAPGQAGSLSISSLTLPENRVVSLDVAYAGDITESAFYEVPVVKSAGLENVTWNLTYNGGEPPTNYRLGVQVRNGVVYGSIGRSGLTIVIR